MNFTVHQIGRSVLRRKIELGRGRGGSHSFVHSTDTTEHLLGPNSQKSLCPAPASLLHFRLRPSHCMRFAHMVS